MMALYLLLNPLLYVDYDTVIMDASQSFSDIPINGYDADYGFIDDNNSLMDIQHPCQPNPSDTDSQYIIAGRTLGHPNDFVDLTVDENDYIHNNNMIRRRNSRADQFKPSSKRPCYRNNAYYNNNNNNNNGYYPGIAPVRGFSIFSERINNNNSNSLSQPIQHTNNLFSLSQPIQHISRSQKVSHIPNNNQREPAVSMSQPMSHINNQINSQPNRFQYLRILKTLKIRNYFSFKCNHEPNFIDFHLVELLYIQDGEWYIGQGKVMSHMSGINLWRDVFNNDNQYGCFLKTISATLYKNKSNILINNDNCILHGEAQMRCDITVTENNEWDKLYTEIHDAVYIEKLKKDQYMKKYASDREQLAYKLFMSDSNKVNCIFDKIVKDYKIDTETKALTEQLKYLNDIINNNPQQYLYLKQFAWLAIQRHYRKIRWFVCLLGETFKSSLLKALKAILGNLVYLLTTFA
eukprot:495150_1